MAWAPTSQHPGVTESLSIALQLPLLQPWDRGSSFTASPVACEAGLCQHRGTAGEGPLVGF